MQLPSCIIINIYNSKLHLGVFLCNKNQFLQTHKFIYLLIKKTSQLPTSMNNICKKANTNNLQRSTIYKLKTVFEQVYSNPITMFMVGGARMTFHEIQCNVKQIIQHQSLSNLLAFMHHKLQIKNMQLFFLRCQ